MQKLGSIKGFADQRQVYIDDILRDFSGKEAKQNPDTLTLDWIEASENPWGIRLLDLRPITQKMQSASTDPKMAENVVSFRSDDGTSFIDQEPKSGNEINADLTFPVDPILAPGIVFIPKEMEHKWAISFYQDRMIFVRSWTRKVLVTAVTSQQNGRLYIHKINGRFFDDDNPEIIRAIVKFLLISHAIGEDFPAPLPERFSHDPQSSAIWAMGLYGNKACFGTFTPTFGGSTQRPLRSHSLLHIAAARNNIDEINLQIENGIPIDIIDPDGLAPLHWSLASEDMQTMKRLIQLGANPDVRSALGVTPMMNAVQSRKLPHIKFLISAGADVNAQDKRGFTSIHRAAEMGQTEVVALLLDHGADPTLEVNGQTPLSLAEAMGEKETISLLRSRPERLYEPGRGRKTGSAELS